MTAPRRAEEKQPRTSLDARLVADCLQGKESGWSALIDKYKNLIFSIPLKYGFSREDSGDIFQLVCLDLLAQLPNIREPNALPAWLIQVTRNKCFHRRQEQQRNNMRQVADPELYEQVPGDEEPAEDLVSQIEQEQLMREALMKLGPRCQRLVRMLFYETPPRPYQDVADTLNLARGSIGFIRQRCLKKLRQLLDEATAK